MSSARLLDLARSRLPADRERLLMAVVDLCDSHDSTAPGLQVELEAIFMQLVVEAERDIRRRLAEKLAHASWAPMALVNVLALDEIEIASPIIATSPLLKDADLIRLLVEATIEHQIEVARRPNLGATVVQAILKRAEPAVITALASNPSAAVTEQDLRVLVQTARRVAALRTPLARHPRLTTALAQQLYLLVGKALRQALTERFQLDATHLDRLLAESIGDAAAGMRGESSPMAAVGESERHEMERRLIEKLHAAGQLRPGYLIRALREQRLSLFATALAMLGRFEAAHVRRAIDSDSADLLALACAAIGIDRSVFPTILGMVSELNGGRPSASSDAVRRTAGAFAPATPQVAGAAFRQAASVA